MMRGSVKSGPLALTLGDPAGIGPEVIVKAWSQLRGAGPPFVVVGDFQALASASSAGSFGLRCRFCFGSSICSRHVRRS